MRLPLRFHLVWEDERAVVTEDFLQERLRRANEIFAPYAIAFEETSERPRIDARHASIERRADRDALAAYAIGQVIHCFVVRGLVDVDEPPMVRRGVHWHAPGGRHYVILSSIGGPDVLAHELGHFLGNPSHSQVAGNLMSYQHTDVLPFLDSAQVARMRSALRRLLAAGELRALATAASRRGLPAAGRGGGDRARP